MEKEVVISIKGMQNYEGALPDVVELVTQGRLAREGERYTLSYQESELTGLSGTLTTIRVDGPEVTLMRVGEFNSQMVFQEGRQHLALYDTPYGALSVAVRTKKMQTCLDPTGGKIEVDYAIEIDHAAAGESLFRIQVRKKPALPQS